MRETKLPIHTKLEEKLYICIFQYLCVQIADEKTKILNQIVAGIPWT
jgi:hypothetical protein